MNQFKNVFYLVLAAFLVVSCDDDNGGETPATPEITNVDATVEASGDGTVVSVTPSGTGASKFSVDFGTDATDDVEETSGPAVVFDYPDVDATYTITITASADGAENVVVTKEVNVTYTAPPAATNLYDFDTTVPSSFKFGNDSDGAATIETGLGDNTTQTLKLVPTEGNWRAVVLIGSKFVSLTDETKRVFTFDYYQSDALAHTVLLKFEGAKTDGTLDIELSATTNAAIGWQTLTFDFADAILSAGKTGDVVYDEFSKLVIFPSVDFGNGGATVVGDYYVDNIQGAAWGDDLPDTDGDGLIDALDACPDVSGTEADGCPPPAETGLIIDFEGDSPPAVEGFESAVLTIVDNPATGGINSSAKALQVVNGPNHWAGGAINLSTPFVFTNGKIFKLKVKVPAARANVPVKLKFEGGSAAIEVDATATASTDWHELSFDFSAQPDENSYNKVVLFFDGGQPSGDGSADWTFLVDDITQSKE